MSSKKRKGRRARGTGSIFFHEGRQRWVGRRVIGGVRIERWGETQGEVVKKLDAATPPGPGTTVETYAEMWYEGLTVRSSTKADYRHTLDRFILPTLGHYRLVDLTAGHVERAAKEWEDNLTVNTIRKNLGHLAGMLECARRSKLIPDNPAADARKPKKRKRAINPFSPDELTAIIRASAEAPTAFPFALLAAVGCRLGEALALDVADFNQVTGMLSISKTYSRPHGIRPPKSENGNRKIRVPKTAVPILTAAIGGRESGPLFINALGARRQHCVVQVSWRSFLERLGLPYRNIHQLRHSVATALISGGVPLGDVARFLGDTVQSIVSHYLHASGVDPTVTLDSLLQGGRKVGSGSAAA